MFVRAASFQVTIILHLTLRNLPEAVVLFHVQTKLRNEKGGQLRASFRLASQPHHDMLHFLKCEHWRVCGYGWVGLKIVLVAWACLAVVEWQR